MSGRKAQTKVKIGWWKRDAEGRKSKVQVFFHAGKLSWEVQSARFEDWVPHQPDDEDWAQLEGDVRNRIQRGLMRAEHLDLVLQRVVLPPRKRRQF